jgi:hypothetical protein
MIEIITAAAFLLAWFGFRYERQRRWRGEVDAAYGLLRAVHHGMVQGLAQDEPVGWGQLYFSTVYTQGVARKRARETYEKVASRTLDYVLVVPTEPLAMLATTPPRPGLIESSTVSIANIALWRVNAFNQLVRSLDAFLTANAAEICSTDTSADRRHDLANAASALSLFVHIDGIGAANATFTGGSVGWYRGFVDAVSKNLGDLNFLREHGSWRWLREWPYVVVDVLAVAGLVATVAVVAA